MSNLEFLRKEAKALLKRCRSRDAAALARMRAELPRLAELDDERAAADIKLADVQYALARESGFPNWGRLKRGADFSQPGSDGSLPENFHPWRWCVSYTVWPEIIAPLVSGREYKMFFRVVRRVSGSEPFTAYADLYRKVTELAGMPKCGSTILPELGRFNQI